MWNLRTLVSLLLLTPSALAIDARHYRSPERPTSTLLWQGAKVDLGGSVSRNGRFLSFTDRETGDLAVRDLSTNTSRVIVAANNAKGSRVRSFAEASTFSPDGRQIAYSWFDGATDRYELWLADLSGDTKPRRVYSAENVEWLAPCDWSPDGKWILAELSLADLSSQLVAISPTEGTLRLLKGR